ADRALLENVGFKLRHQPHAGSPQALAQWGGGYHVDETRFIQQHTIYFPRRLGRHESLAQVESDALRRTLEWIAIAAAARRAEHDAQSLLQRMTRDLAGRVEMFNGSMPVDPCRDWDARQATKHAARRHPRAVREQGIAGPRSEHAQGSLHRQSTARSAGSTRVDGKPRALYQKRHARLDHFRRLHRGKITPIDARNRTWSIILGKRTISAG